MTHHIQAGKTAPCEVVQGVTVLFQGTHTACTRYIAEQRGAMHISDQIAQLLLDDGWKFPRIDKMVFTKKIAGFAEAGTVSNGDRTVTLTIDASGRWLSRVDGWNHVEKDVDLRDYSTNPKGAIVAVLR